MRMGQAANACTAPRCMAATALAAILVRQASTRGMDRIDLMDHLLHWRILDCDVVDATLRQRHCDHLFDARACDVDDKNSRVRVAGPAGDSGKVYRHEGRNRLDRDHLLVEK